jgi:tetratricopeptide (TPR) repeat protein
LIDLYPNQSGAENAYSLLAHAHRELGETDSEIAMLNKVAERSSDATDSYERLMQIAAARQDWTGVIANSERFAAVNPLSLVPHRFAAEAHEALGEKPAAITSYRTLLRLGPPDPVEIHFRLARLLHATGDPGAKREVLLALEEAPRFREAHRLLLEIEESAAKQPATENKKP